MRKFLPLVISAMCVSCSPINRSDISSRELDEYYKNRYASFKMPSLPTAADVISFRPEYCTLSEIDDYTVYSKIKAWDNPFYVEHSVWMDDYWNKYMENLEHNENCYNPPSLGGVVYFHILKHEKNRDIEVIIYESSDYTDFEEGLEIALAVTTDDGQTWNYYHTGLYNRQPVEIKWYSEIPTIINEHTFQIEAALVKQDDFYAHPGPSPEFSLVKDGIVVTFDTNLLAYDSDGDGLTDIIEKKFRTDADNPDSDSDGISDNIDLNPRYNIPADEFTVFYEEIIKREFDPDMLFFERVKDAKPGSKKWMREVRREERRLDFVPFESKNESGAEATEVDKIRNLLIVSDNPSIHAIFSNYIRAIIITQAEYDASGGDVFELELDRLHLSGFFRVDGHKNMYLVDCGYMTGSTTYIVKKNRRGWKYKKLRALIS